MKATTVLLWHSGRVAPRLYGLLQVGDQDKPTLVRFWSNRIGGIAHVLSDRGDANVVSHYRNELLWEKRAKGYQPVAQACFDVDYDIKVALDNSVSRWLNAEIAGMVLNWVKLHLQLDLDTYEPTQRDVIEADPRFVPAFNEGTNGLIYVPPVSLVHRRQPEMNARYSAQHPEYVRWGDEESGAQILRMPWEDLTKVDTSMTARCGIGDDRDDPVDVLASAVRIYSPASPGPLRWFRAALHDARRIYAKHTI